MSEPDGITRVYLGAGYEVYPLNRLRGKPVTDATHKEIEQRSDFYLIRSKRHRGYKVISGEDTPLMIGTFALEVYDTLYVGSEQDGKGNTVKATEPIDVSDLNLDYQSDYHKEAARIAQTLEQRTRKTGLTIMISC